MSAFDCVDCGLKALTLDYNEIRPLAASSTFRIGKRGMAAPTTKQIEIVVNGEVRLAPEGRTLRELLVWLEVDPERVAVELDRSIVQRAAWDRAIVGPGASLEIVQFVGGG
jgi:sulfur carrier protein